jgi:hypothetical protein
MIACHVMTSETGALGLKPAELSSKKKTSPEYYTRISKPWRYIEPPALQTPTISA